MGDVTSFDGCKLHVVVDGERDASAVLLSHYLGGSSATFDALAAVLASDHRVVRFDTRGHGGSDAPTGSYSVEMLARDALAVLDALGIQSADIVGVSQGGMAGMWLAANHPNRVRRLVLANTTPFIPNKPVWDDLAAKAMRDGMTDIARTTIKGWLSQGFKASQPEVAEALVNLMATMPVRGFVGNTCVLRDVDLRDRLAAITAPTLVIGGEEDGPRGASAPVMANGVQHGRLVLISAAAHLSHIENPARFNAEVTEFLSDARQA